MTTILLLACLAAPAELLNAERAMGFTGEALPTATCRAVVVPTPGVPGKFSLKLVFRIDAYQDGNWLDAMLRPSPPIALDARLPLKIRAEQPAGYLTIKLTDPDNPGANRAAYEQPLTQAGAPLPSGQWVDLDLPLPADPKLRDGIDSIGFYIAMFNKAAPLHQDLVFHVGQFDYVPPTRPPWPPEPTADNAMTAISLPPIGQPGGPWVAVSPDGPDNQSKFPATLKAGEARFVANQEGWNEFLHTDPAKLVLKPNTTYTLQFDYTVDEAAHGGPANEAVFYFLVRATGTIQKDVGWQRWNDTPGTSGRRMVTFTTLDMPDYYLIWGVRHLGALTIGDIKLWTREAAR